MKKWLKITLIVLGSLLFLLLLVAMLVSPIAKSYVNKHGKELVGREINVEKLRVNLLAGRVKVYELTVFEDDDTTAFFSFDTLDVSVKLRKLLRQELYVRHITLASPKIRVIQNGDRFNFSTIVDHFSSTEEPDNDTTPSQWKLGFYNIRLSDGEIYYADRKLQSDWDLKNINIKVPGVYFDGSENTDAGLALQLADGGVLRTDASLNMDNNQFVVDLALEKFAISNVRAYLADVMNVGKIDGVLNAAFNVNGNLSDIMKMNIVGNLSLLGVNIMDNNNDKVLGFDKLAVDVNRINLSDNVFDIKSVVINKLVSHFDLYQNDNNFGRLFATSGKPSAPHVEESPAPVTDSAARTTETTPMQFNIGSFVINEAQITYNDFTLPERFSFPITNLNIKAENVSLNGENNANIQARLPHGGLAFIRWHGNIDNWKQNQYLALTIKNLQLKDLSPYSVAYLGYPFTDGTFSFTSENTIKFSQLNGINKLDLYKPEVGEKRGDVEADVNIPLKAALYILKDKDDKVQFDIPVAGNIDSPEFSYMKIVWKTLGNLMVKVATSPFRAVSKALGLSGDMDYIAFDPLQAHLNSEQYNTFNKIAEVLNYDTSIVISLIPQIDGSMAAKAQSLYLLKEEYYLMSHHDIRQSNIMPQVLIYEDANAISLKDTGFVSFLHEKGLKSKKPTEKELQRFAEQLYPKEAALTSLEILSGYRNEFIRKYFFEQMGVNEKQLTIGTVVTNAIKSGYIIESQFDEHGENPSEE